MCALSGSRVETRALSNARVELAPPPPPHHVAVAVPADVVEDERLLDDGRPRHLLLALLRVEAGPAVPAAALVGGS